MKLLAHRIYRFLKAEPVLLGAALVCVIGVWGFVELADEIKEGSTQNFDEWAVRLLRSQHDPARPIGPAWVAEAARDVTGLGGTFLLCLLTLAVSIFLWLRQGYRTLILLSLSTGLGSFLSLILKGTFQRPRPDLVPHLSHVATSSFPSGHSMLSAIVYLTLAAIVAATLSERRLKVYVFLLAFLVTGLVGLSRVYLGVHYPTDVLAGWTAGIVWALLCWTVAARLQRQGTIEPEKPAAGKDTN